MLKSLRLFALNDTLGMSKRGLWQWIDDTFNRIDDDRIKEVGPNMACAEWLMKNGAQVRWKGCNEFVSHYDCLPTIKCGSSEKFQIEQVYAGKEASISHVGFCSFKNCEKISDVAFDGCPTIDNEALEKLSILKKCLTNLKINGCLNVTDTGLLSLKHLEALKFLELKNLQFVNEQKTIDDLKTNLPKCNIIYEPVNE